MAAADLEDSASRGHREHTPEGAGELVAELGPRAGERPGRGVVVGQRALDPTLTPMPRTPMLGWAPGTYSGIGRYLEDAFDRAPCGCPPVEPEPNWAALWG